MNAQQKSLVFFWNPGENTGIKALSRYAFTGIQDGWVWWKIPRPHPRRTTLDDLIDWNAPCNDLPAHHHLLSLVSSDALEQVKGLSQTHRRVFPAYKRTRNHHQVLELRFDGIAGCLRTPNGGSSRQNLVLAENGHLRTRLLTVRETARLMGAPDTYALPGTYNDGYWAMGDAVAVPVADHLASNLLAPLAQQFTRKQK